MNTTSERSPHSKSAELAAAGANTQGDDALNLIELWRILWSGKWLIVAITALFGCLSVAYALLATEWYRAEVLLMPATSKSASGLSSQLGQLSGLASLAGINIGKDGNSAEPLAVLKSRDFARSFIDELGLLPVLFADDWDAQAGKWKLTDPRDVPDLRDAVRYFDEDVRRVQEDKKTGLVSLTIEWTDPVEAARWANLLVDRVNDRMRQRALHDAESNLSYLQKELATANVVALQESVGRLIENEMQNLMLAKGNQEFAFRIVDQATPPKWRSHPKRVQVVALAVVGGGLIAIFVVFIRHNLRQAAQRSREKNRAGRQPTSPSAAI